MASSSSSTAYSAIHLHLLPHQLNLIACILLSACLVLGSALENRNNFKAIYAFGNSLTDTGNLLHVAGDNIPESRPPFGETYFHRPTGRNSDGRLFIDFVAQALGLPLVPPYLAGNGTNEFRKGANFAVTGSNALPNDFFTSHGINATWTDYSLITQLTWFKQLKPSIPDSKLKKSLFIIGEMGVNDYGPFFMSGQPDETRAIVPSVINAIGSAVSDLIELGANKVVVGGLFPIGCSPVFLTLFGPPEIDSPAYDSKTGCLKWFNKFAQYHNTLLQQQIHSLQVLYHPQAKITYADFYEPIMDIIRSPSKFGVEEPLVACCGKGGRYNMTPFTIKCGDPEANLCSDPSTYVSWDGLHMTESTYGVVARRFLSAHGDHAHAAS